MPEKSVEYGCHCIVKYNAMRHRDVGIAKAQKELDQKASEDGRYRVSEFQVQQMPAIDEEGNRIDATEFIITAEYTK